MLTTHAVWHHPPSHPYIDALWPARPGDRRAEDTWDVATVARAGTRIVHLHFGFEHLSGDELDDWVQELRRHEIRLVHTVHDIDNPHLTDQTAFHDGLRRVVAAADALATLTPTARATIATRFRRSATVVPHPHVVPLTDLATMTDPTSRRGIYVHVATGRPNLDLALLTSVATLDDRPPLRLHARASAPPSVLQRLDGLRGHPGVDVEIGERLTDRQLWARIATAELVLLPYRWGTHSGLLEAAHDLGTPVVAPPIGGYCDQGAHRLAAGDLAGSLHRAVRRTPSITPAGRIAARGDARRAYDRLYLDALAAPG